MKTGARSHECEYWWWTAVVGCAVLAALVAVWSISPFYVLRFVRWEWGMSIEVGSLWAQWGHPVGPSDEWARIRAQWHDKLLGWGFYPNSPSNVGLDRVGLVLPKVKALNQRTAFGPALKYLGTQVRIPLWIPFSVVAAITTLALMQARRHRVAPGHCGKCNYDLTGNTSAVCSECGTPVDPPAAEKA